MNDNNFYIDFNASENDGVNDEFAGYCEQSVEPDGESDVEAEQARFGETFEKALGKTPRTRTRWIELRDAPALLAIEREAFEFPWTRDDFECCLRTPTCAGFLIEEDGAPVGYLFFETRPRSFRLLSVAVERSARRKEIGSKLVRRMIAGLDRNRSKIVCVVRERNVPAQLFLRSLGFRATRVERDYYLETNEDAYRMTYRAAFPDALGLDVEPKAPPRRRSRTNDYID